MSMARNKNLNKTIKFLKKVCGLNLKFAMK